MRPSGTRGHTIPAQRSNHPQVTSTESTGCIKKVDPFEFKTATTYCINLTNLIALN